jgi:CBS domain-containing protein
MKAGDVMTRKIVSVSPDETVLQAARKMLQHRISGLPVIDEVGNLVGMLSEGDFLRRQEIGSQRKRSRWLEFLMGPGKMAAEYTHSHGRKVREVMSTNVLSVSDDASMEEVVESMERHQIKRVPVLRGNKIVGIVTRSNIMHAVVSLARTEPKAAKGDAGIREKLLAALDQERWAPVSMSNVVVRDGVVELWGVIVDERQREALRVAAENIPGVKAVKDHLVWLEPTSGVLIEQDEKTVGH